MQTLLRFGILAIFASSIAACSASATGHASGGAGGGLGAYCMTSTVNRIYAGDDTSGGGGGLDGSASGSTGNGNCEGSNDPGDDGTYANGDPGSDPNGGDDSDDSGSGDDDSSPDAISPRLHAANVTPNACFMCGVVCSLLDAPAGQPVALSMTAASTTSTGDACVDAERDLTTYAETQLAESVAECASYPNSDLGAASFRPSVGAAMSDRSGAPRS